MQLKLHMVTIEDLVPQDHFLRKLEAALDLSFVEEETAYLYSRRYGRPPIDPVVLVKYLLVGFLYGIPTEFKHDDFRYDEENDLYVCSQGNPLRRNILTRTASGLYWQYIAQKADCKDCPLRHKCLSETNRRGARKLEHSYFRPAVSKHLERRGEPVYREALKKRQIWCEGTFAAQKWGHNLTRVLRRGLEAAEDHCLLSATTLNLKRMIRAAN